MNRMDWEKHVFASDMNPTARMVCMAIGSFGNWTEDREVWPSIKAVADMAGISRETAGKYIDALEDQGWLVHLNTLRNNVKVYDLRAPLVVDSIGILAVKKRGRQFSKDYQPESGCRNSRDVVVDTVVDRLSNGSSEVVECEDTNIKELKEEPTIEPTTSVPVATAPVPHEEELEVRKDSPPSLNFSKTDMISYYSKNIQYTSLTSKERSDVRELMLDPNFEPEELTPSRRMNAAVKEAREEEEVEVEW